MTDKFELAKSGTVCPENNEVVRIDENRYVILNNPYSVIINTTYTLRNQEENKSMLEFIEKYIGEFLHNF